MVREVIEQETYAWILLCIVSGALGSLGVFSTRLLTANEEMRGGCRYSHPIQWTGECEMVFKQLKQKRGSSTHYSLCRLYTAFHHFRWCKRVWIRSSFGPGTGGFGTSFLEMPVWSFHPSAGNDANYSFLKLESVTTKRAVVEKLVGTTKKWAQTCGNEEDAPQTVKSIHHSLFKEYELSCCTCRGQDYWRNFTCSLLIFPPNKAD